MPLSADLLQLPLPARPPAEFLFVLQSLGQPGLPCCLSGCPQPWVPSDFTRWEVSMSGSGSLRLEAPGRPGTTHRPGTRGPNSPLGPVLAPMLWDGWSRHVSSQPGSSSVLWDSGTAWPWPKTQFPQLWARELLVQPFPVVAVAGDLWASAPLQVSPCRSAGHAAWPHGLRRGVWVLLRVQGGRPEAELLDAGEVGPLQAQPGVRQRREGALRGGCHLFFGDHL